MSQFWNWWGLQSKLDKPLSRGPRKMGAMSILLLFIIIIFFYFFLMFVCLFVCLFVCFGFSVCFPCFFGSFLSFCYISCQFSAFSSILWPFPLDSLCIFAIFFRRFHVFLQFYACFSLFAIMFYNSEILRSLPFNWGYVLLSFRYISCRFYADLMFSFDFTVFWFHFDSLLLGSR